MSSSISNDGVKLNRRQALLLTATATAGAALAKPARALDSTKTARAPGAGKLLHATARPSQAPNTARCAAFSMAASSRSKAFPMARIPAATTLAAC